MINGKMYNKVTPEIIAQLKAIAGDENVLSDEESIAYHSEDETEDLSFPPEVIVKPSTAEQISGILKLANEYSIPVTPRGGGTGLSGGALTVYGGICLSMAKFNRIIEIDEKNFQAIVQPGVITQVFQEAVEKLGLFYPLTLHPRSVI
jgi:glycolate oxidase